MRTPLLAAALTAILAAGPSSGAAPKPQITDPAGDVFPAAGAGADVVSALFSAAGAKGKPSKLVVTMTYAGAVNAADNLARVVEFHLPGCGRVYLEVFRGGTYGDSPCARSFEFASTTAGRTVRFTLPFLVLGAQHLRKGATLTGLRTYTAYTDPVFGYEPVQAADGLGAAAADDAVTRAGYTIG